MLLTVLVNMDVDSLSFIAIHLIQSLWRYLRTFRAICFSVILMKAFSANLGLRCFITGKIYYNNEAKYLNDRTSLGYASNMTPI